MTLKYLLHSLSMLLQGTYEGSLWRYYPLSLLCWLILALSSIFSLRDMCHSLIGYKEAQSMCSPLMQSEPSLAISSSLHLSHQSLKPLAYKLDPLPLKFITIYLSKVTMPFWEAKSTSKPSNSIEAFGSKSSIHPKLWSKDKANQQGKIIWESLSMDHILNMVFSLVSHEVMFC